MNEHTLIINNKEVKLIFGKRRRCFFGKIKKYLYKNIVIINSEEGKRTIEIDKDWQSEK